MKHIKYFLLGIMWVIIVLAIITGIYYAFTTNIGGWIMCIIISLFLIYGIGVTISEELKL